MIDDEKTKVTPPPFPPRPYPPVGYVVDSCGRQSELNQDAENTRFMQKRMALSEIVNIFEKITLTQDRYCVLRAVRSLFDE